MAESVQWSVRTSRIPALLTGVVVEVEVDDEILTGQIIDISLTGAQISTCEQLTEGTRISIRIQSATSALHTTGTVCWSGPNGNFGCEFDEKLDYRELGRLLASS